MNIVLIGFMGSGKTAVGQELAKKLNRPFHDMDAIIEKEGGMTIARIFAERGEAFFRGREAALAGRLAAADGGVIACGGGAVLNPDNVRSLAKSGILVLVTAGVDTLVDRLKGMEDRPLLAGGDLKKRIEALIEERRSYYEAAQVRVENDGRSVEEVADEIIKKVSPKLKGNEAA